MYVAVSLQLGTVEQGLHIVAFQEKFDSNDLQYLQRLIHLLGVYMQASMDYLA